MKQPLRIPGLLLLFAVIIIVILILNREKPEQTAITVDPEAIETLAPETPVTDFTVDPPEETTISPAESNAQDQAFVMQEYAPDTGVILPEGDPIPDFDMQGLINEALQAFRKNLSTE